MICEQRRNPEIVEQYLAGTLSSDESAEFESHYFECDECLSAVQTGQAIQRVGDSANPPARKPASKVLEMPVRSTWRRGYSLAAAAAVIIATFLGWRAIVSPQPARPESAANTGASPIANPIPVHPPAAEPQPIDSRLLASNRLETVEALPYRASVLRGGGDDAAERFHVAMQAYSAHDYRKARSGLSAIPVGVAGSGKPENHVTDAGIQLYLGVSQLMLTENGDAVRALRRAVAYGDTPYFESAGFYLAKGLIRQKQYTQAADQLRQTVALNGDRRREAESLLTQLNALPNQLPSR